MKRFRRPEQQKWYAGETISVGIGQGYNAYTPLQLAQAMATLANNGVMYRPHLVNYIENSSTGERTYVEREPLRTIALKPQNIEFIRNAMVGVNKEGTGARAFAGAEYTSAGKTGTAQVVALKQNEKYQESRVQERHRDHALFIAFAPVESPKIALAVLVENAGFGARAAAPIARQVLDYYLLGKRPPQSKRRPPRRSRTMPMKAIDRLVARIAAPIDGSLLSIAGGLLLLGLLTLYSASYDNPARITAPVVQRRHRARGDVDRGAGAAADADALRRPRLSRGPAAAGRGGAVRRRQQRRAPLAYRWASPASSLRKS